MPLGRGVRYRVKTTGSGKKVRLAFRGNRVVEAKNLGSGATDAEGEFRADRKWGMVVRSRTRVGNKNWH